MVSSPKAPDPKETAAAQSGMNRDTALTQQQVNMVNQVTPDGNLTYNQTGSSSFVDSSGKVVTTPTYTATTSLSPQQQAIKNQTDAASLHLGELANDQSLFLRDYLSKDFDVDAEVEKKLYDLGASRLDPRFAQDENALRSRLIASGIRPGTEQFDQQMAQFGQTKNDAYNQLALTGRQQAYQEAVDQRSRPINEISALLSGAQVQNPEFTATPTATVGGVDYTGAVNNKYQADVSAANAKMGGLFGLAAAPFGMFSFSDIRLKTDINRIGTLENGLPVYAYRMIDGGPMQIGLMAHEVEEIRPEAVATHDSGYKMVDYERAVV